MKKHFFVIMVAAAVTVALAGCASSRKATNTDRTSDTKNETSVIEDTEKEAQENDSSAASNSSEGTGTVQIANPWSDYDSQEEAENAAGAALTLPETLPFTYTTKINRAIPDEMLEIIYEDSTGKEVARFRKAFSSEENEDISGDYNKYTITKKMKANNRRVEIRGDSVDSYHVASWTGNGYAYSITSETGLAEKTILSLAGIIN